MWWPFNRHQIKPSHPSLRPRVEKSHLKIRVSQETFIFDYMFKKTFFSFKSCKFSPTFPHILTVSHLVTVKIFSSHFLTFPMSDVLLFKVKVLLFLWNKDFKHWQFPNCQKLEDPQKVGKEPSIRATNVQGMHYPYHTSDSINSCRRNMKSWT